MLRCEHCPAGNLVTELAAALQSPDSSIRDLTLGNTFIWTRRPNVQRYTILEMLLHSVGLSRRLERLELLTIHSRRHMDPVLRMIRATKSLKELDLRISDEALHRKDDLLDAIMTNYSLRSFRLSSPHPYTLLRDSLSISEWSSFHCGTRSDRRDDWKDDWNDNQKRRLAYWFD